MKIGLRMQGGLPVKHAKSKMKEWDLDVVCGCYVLITDGFLWNDITWGIDRAELAVRVEEWNSALETYCDNEGLAGERRIAVIAQHTASPLAPCANMACAVHETRIKQFKCCSGCKSVAYCSKECQKDDWASHKGECKSGGITNMNIGAAGLPGQGCAQS